MTFDFAGLSSNLAYITMCLSATSVLTRLVRLTNASPSVPEKMVEINNQRKAFLDMLAWSEGTDNGRQKTRNHGYDVIVGGESLHWLLRSLSRLITLNPKLKSTGAGRYQLFPAGGCHRQAAWPERLLRKVRTLWHCSRLRSGALPMIDHGDIRQAIDRCSTPGLHQAGAGYGQFGAAPTAWLQNSKKWAERSERLMYEQSHRDYLRSGYLHHRLPVMGC